MSAPTRRRQAKSIAAEQAFHARVAEIGGTVVGEYATAMTPVDCICPAGHTCRPCPANLQRGVGMCQICGLAAGGRKRRRTGEAAFRKHVAALGGQVVGEYVDMSTRVDCLCAVGHTCRPLPTSLQRGIGMCLTCAGQDPAAVAVAFYDRVTDLGGKVVGEYVNALTPVACVCAAGHPCWPVPSKLQQGRGLCRVCSGKDPAAAKAAFRARVAELGGRVVGNYVSVATPVACICANGHACQPRPNDLKRGQGLCRTCVGLSPVVAEAAFRAVVTAQGGFVVGTYIDSSTPIACICRFGHDCAPIPSNIQRGQGMCRRCQGKTWDAFYVVTNPVEGRLKFGITSGDTRPRLRGHRRAGYVDVVRVLPDLPGAHDLENHVVDSLRESGIAAVRGREYFGIDALPVVLAIVDRWVLAMTA